MLLILAIKSAESIEHLNPVFALFENNLLNWLLLVGVIIYFCNKLLPGLFAARKQSIETALQEASTARAEGLAFLETQKQKIANAEKDAENILVEARNMAEQMKAEMVEQTKKEVTDLATKIEQQIANERQLAVTQLRTAAARAAIKLTEASLTQHVSESSQQRLLKQFLEQMEAGRN